MTKHSKLILKYLAKIIGWFLFSIAPQNFNLKNQQPHGMMLRVAYWNYFKEELNKYCKGL